VIASSRGYPDNCEILSFSQIWIAILSPFWKVACAAAAAISWRIAWLWLDARLTSACASPSPILPVPGFVVWH